MTYKITNTGRTTKAYYATNGIRISVDPGQTVRRKNRPPEGEPGWDVEEIEEQPKQDDERQEGGDE